jgi:hypothetical protein
MARPRVCGVPEDGKRSVDSLAAKVVRERHGPLAEGRRRERREVSDWRLQARNRFVHRLVHRGSEGEHVKADASPLELEKLGENERLGELREIPKYVANRGLTMAHDANKPSGPAAHGRA